MRGSFALLTKLGRTLITTHACVLQHLSWHNHKSCIACATTNEKYVAYFLMPYLLSASMFRVHVDQMPLVKCADAQCVDNHVDVDTTAATKK